MRLPGWNKAKYMARRVASRIGPRAIILLYHRVTRLEFDPQRLSVHPENFELHLQALRSLGLEPVRLSELPAWLKSRHRNDPPAVVLTFDDGYADNLLEAEPLLMRHQIPATVFVTTGFVEHGTECWWDELERLLFSPRTKAGTLCLQTRHGERRWEMPAPSSTTTEWDVHQPAQQALHKAYLELAALIRLLPPPERASTLEVIRQWAGHPPPRDSHRAMTPEELKVLISGDLVEIGAHTVNHPVLSSLPRPDQQNEILESRQRLEQLTERPISTFSYPYGRIEDYSSETVRLVREAGFLCACSNFPGLANRWTDPFQYPRFVIGNWGYDPFVAHLKNFLSS